MTLGIDDVTDPRRSIYKNCIGKLDFKLQVTICVPGNDSAYGCSKNIDYLRG